MLLVKGWGKPAVIGWRRPRCHRAGQLWRRGPAFVYLAIAATRTAVTHLTMMSLKVNWPLFQRDDNANWVAKHNTESCCVPLKGGGGQIKWPYNGGCQALADVALCWGLHWHISCLSGLGFRRVLQDWGPDGLTQRLTKAVKQRLVIKKRQLHHNKRVAW